MIIDDPQLAVETIKRNRMLLQNIDTWIDQAALSRSPFQYGVPDIYRDALDIVPDDSMSLTDYICYFASKTSDLCYLEIGLSVARNMWQVLHACKNASLTGFDMDNLYPVVSNKLRSLSCEMIPTQHVSVRKDPPQKECFSHDETNNHLTIISGDEFDESLWQVMKGQKFNLVFSDAMHTPEALLYEWNRLQTLGLLNRNGFTMVWDDIHSPGMREAFETICQDACATLGVSPDQCALLLAPGWIGKREPPHRVGVISSNGFVS